MRLTTELSFIPVWTIGASRENFEDPSTGSGTADSDAEALEAHESVSLEKIPFVLGQMFGYFDENAVVYTSKTFPFKATVTENSYCIYGSTDMKEKFSILDSDGNETGKISASGFPFFTENGKFLFLPGGASFSKIDDEGNVLWTFEGYSPITAFSTSKGGIAVGTSDGTVVVFNGETGEIRHSFVPGGSETPAIFGCDISEDGKYFACLTGLNRQRFVVVQEKKGHTEIIFHKFLNSQVRRQAIVKFDEASNVVYYDCADGVGIVSLKTLKDSSLPVKGRVLTIKESLSNNFVFVLSDEISESGKKYTVSVLEPFDSVAGSFSFEATNAFIQVKGKMLFVGRDTEISRIDIEKI